MISQHVVDAFCQAFDTGQRDEVRAALAAAFAAARREIAHEALKAPVADLWGRDVVMRAAPFMAQCGPCDFGLAEFPCACPQEDFRPIVADLVTEVERLRRRERY